MTNFRVKNRIDFPLLKVPSKIKPLSGLALLSVFMTFALTGVIFLLKYAHSVFLLRYFFLIMGALCGLYFSIKERTSRLAIVFAGLFAVSFFFCMLFQEDTNCSATDFIYTICYVFLSIVLLHYVQYFSRIGLFMVTLISGYICLRLFSGTSINNILLANSQNYVSILILFFLLLYYASCYRGEKKYYIFPSLLFFLDCILVQGRGGILVSGLFCICICFFKLTTIRNKRKKRFMIGLIVILTLSTVVCIVTLGQVQIQIFLQENFSRFYAKGALDADRFEIWSRYLRHNCSSLRTLLFSSNTGLIRDDRNLHNSFLMCYAAYGLGMFLVIIGFIVYSVVVAWKKKEYFMLMLFSFLILRAMTDKMFYQGYCEIFLYFFLFYFHSIRKESVNGNAFHRFLFYLHDSSSNH